MKVYHSAHPLWYGRSDELLNRDKAHIHIKESFDTADFVLTLHWPWEWNIGLAHLDRFLGEVKETLR
jgi:hypothetical protein